MPSLRARFFVAALSLRNVLERNARKNNRVDWTTSIEKMRRDVEVGAARMGKLPENLEITPVDIDGLYAEWMQPKTASRDRVILYFHGGGLVMGSVKSHRGIVGKFVHASGIPALTIEYGVAPENPFPKGLNDAVKAYKYLLNEGILPENIMFMGDSGGGNLVFAAQLALKQQTIPLPKAVVALSPWVDLTNSGDSLHSNAKKDKLSWKDAQLVFADYYVGENDASAPLASPLFGDLKGLPPMLLYVGGHELLRDDSIRLAEKAQAAGVDVTLHVGKGLFHCYPAVAPLIPEATQALTEIAAFIQKHLSS